MKPFAGTLVLISSVALCLSVHAQDAANPSPVAAQPPSVAAAGTNTVALSDIRIVRLSQVRGVVQIDRHIGRSYEDAFANIPITTGTRLRTQVGLAEVEFEDDSTLRLTPDSEVVFTALKRTPTGATISNVAVLRGMVYAALANTKNNTFTVATGNASVELNRSGHIRLAVDSPLANLTVLDGTVQLTLGSSTTTLAKKTAIGFNTSGSQPAIAVKIEKSAFDQWDKNGNEYQKQYSSLRSGGVGGPVFGLSDLNYYGSFVNMPGCGTLWQPYFVSSAWTPYDNGTWAWYPNAGYSWVSPYPWGWLPFHSGNWMSCGGAGWGWQPGGGFTGLQNTALIPARANRPVLTAPAPPRGVAPALVRVNVRPLAVSSVSAPGTFTFRKDSAGLGVPRDAFGELRHISTDVVRHGQMNTEIERGVIGPQSAFANSRGVNAVSGRNAGFAPGSRSVDTFSRPGVDSHANMGQPAGWSDMPHDMRGSERSGPSMPRSEPRPAPASMPSAPSAGGAHK